ncbi:MAG TPA: non-canonical purine NTP pyrophosphatase [Pyrinomonadaceae bacterium]|jgi:XTP/dITP diphosphohydrolase
MTANPPLEILVATRNEGKVRELHEALSSLPIKLRSLDEFPNILPVDEVGHTYEQNAAIKALGYARQTGVCSLADDSGLEVDALGGKPGVLSARFVGEHASDTERIEKLLKDLSQYADDNRAARFVCCMALAGWETQEKSVANGEPQLLTVAQEECDGVIAAVPRGINGFGFDPVFVPDGYEQTFGELPSEVKARISHRALALVRIRRFLSRWLGHDVDASC